MATDTSAPLPDVDLQSLSTFTVTLDDPAAVITSLTVHGEQESGPDIETLTLQDVYLTPNAPPEINPANFGGPAG